MRRDVSPFKSAQAPNTDAQKLRHLFLGKTEAFPQPRNIMYKGVQFFPKFFFKHIASSLLMGLLYCIF